MPEEGVAYELSQVHVQYLEKPISWVNPGWGGHQQQQEGAADNSHQCAPPHKLPERCPVHGAFLSIAQSLQYCHI